MLRKGSFFLGVLLLCACPLWVDGGPSYENMTKLFENIIGPSSGYNTLIRPVKDHSQRTTIVVSFEILAIVEIDAIQQKFIVNGFMGLQWLDQIIPWNPLDYNNAYVLVTRPEDIWRPRLVMTNTLSARDLFKDDFSPTLIIFNGSALWYPGSLFPASCKLNLYKFPFDTQNCFLEFYSMGYDATQIVFSSATRKVGTNFFVESGEWVIEGTSIETFIETTMGGFRIKFTIRRLPGFFIVNIVTPVVLMSFLNILVFVIPVESGEKISYGITVLLALTVFMSIVSEQLPRSSDTLPLVTFYLLVLTCLSVCTVVVAVAIVRIHHCDKKETSNRKAKSNFKSAFHKFKLASKTAAHFNSFQVKPTDSTSTTTTRVSPIESHQNQQTAAEKVFDERTRGQFNAFRDFKCKSKPNDRETTPPMDYDEESEHDHGNRWNALSKHIDSVSFIVFTIIWLTVTLAFLIEMSR